MKISTLNASPLGLHFVVEAIPPPDCEKADDTKDDNWRNHKDQDTTAQGSDTPAAG